MYKSEAIRVGIRKSFADVNSKIANRTCYGYKKLNTGDLVIDETEANIVRLIFERYLASDSLGTISKLLEEQGVISPTGKLKWNKEAINKLISNEKYTGQVMLQKTYSFCGEQYKNENELRKVLITNHHEAIISFDIFEKVQMLKSQRAKT